MPGQYDAEQELLRRRAELAADGHDFASEILGLQERIAKGALSGVIDDRGAEIVLLGLGMLIYMEEIDLNTPD